ncbi:sel1 repeat family protein [Colwellia psychrerythraea]|uniref:Uncharacterized protein n=1 Tax=Colwellia psychrerythraea TaxID=28229 RepID=A0A099KYT7_COLPS|nr:sel1 repeat family protein [Colwellia psychrerythraea]KGJ95909.1 hypothetical protein GAB14E_1821 [Colwellia psychrerythraea]
MILPFIVSSCASPELIRKTTYSLEVKEFNGIKHYKNGNYEEAFNLLKEPAAWGYKGSQYAIAFMFLKGQYLQQSTLLGMGWLGVAKEANVKDWSKQYDAFYSSATKGQKLEFDKIKEVYIKKYGLIAQDVTCRKSLSGKSRRVRIECYHYEGIGVLYDIDLVE